MLRNFLAGNSLELINFVVRRKITNGFSATNHTQTVVQHMQKQLLKYLILPLFYIFSVVLMEFNSNIIISGIWLVSILLCLIGLAKLLTKKLDLKRKWIPILLLLIPILDLTLGITNNIRNVIKGDIVLSIIDDSFATTKSVTLRKKNGEITAEFYNSVAGFGEMEKAKAEVINDSVFIFELINRKYSEKLTFDREKQSLRDKNKNLNYRILKNEIFK